MKGIICVGGIMSDWIMISDEPPEKGSYLTVWSDNEQAVMPLEGNEKYFTGWPIHQDIMIAYMPLPRPPE